MQVFVMMGLKFMMIRVIICILFLGGAVVPCFAEDSGSSLGMGSDAKPLCAITSAPTVTSENNMSLTSAGNDHSVITVAELVDEATAKLKQASIQLSLQGVCNQPHHLGLMSINGALLPTATPENVNAAFITKIQYTATAAWGSTTSVLQTDGTPGKTSSVNSIGGANRGFLIVDITINQTNNSFDMPVLAGTFTDTLIIQIGTPY
jgi:hypothetical protein